MSTSIQEVVTLPSSTRPASAPPSVVGRVSAELLDRLIGRIALASVPHHSAPVHAPFSGELVREIPLATEQDIGDAVRRAREAQPEWARRSFRERAAVLLRMHDRILERQDELLDLIQLESGKARKHAFEEIADAALVLRYYAHHSEEHLAPRRRRGVFPGITEVWEHHHPVGVVGLIVPWNYPLSMAVTDAIPALMAGNAVVIKPDMQTPFTALWIARLLDEVGLPAGLFQVVTGRGREIGNAIVQAVDYVVFTGSTATGRSIARQAGENLIGCSLELGGKNPMLVLDDADVDRAAAGAVRGCFANAGQLCMHLERVYVHASIYDRFLSRFAERTRAMKLGAGFDYDADMGALSSRAQLEKVERHVRDALDKGATAAAGGKARPDLGPLFFEPTILINVSEEMEVCREETFGPVASVYRFEHVEEAIQRANASRYGLNASVWTADPEFGRTVATRLQAGTVNVNEAYAAAWASMDAPMGGFKDSGLGRRHGPEGILKYTEAQTVSIQHLIPLAAPFGISELQYSKVMSEALRWMRRIPGLR